MTDPMITIKSVYRSYLTVSGYSEATITHRLRVLHLIQNAGIDPMTATPGDLLRWLATFANPETKHSYRAALRSFYAWALDYEYVIKDPTTKIPKVRVPRHLPRPVSDETLATLLRTTSGETRAVCLVMAYCGLRGAEACSLDRSDFVTVGDHQRVIVRVAKGGAQESVPIPDWVAEQARDYFPITISHGAMVQRITRRLHMIDPDASPHCLRHWFGTTVLNLTGNVRVVQELLRHKSLSSTQIYTLVTSDNASAASDLLPHIA